MMMCPFTTPTNPPTHTWQRGEWGQRGAEDTGVAFLSGGGTVVQRVLAAGEKYVIDDKALVAAESSVDIGALS
jgi:uncharacterized protein (AIM24 family)